MPRRPRIAVTMGDPAGVGPELCLRMLQDPKTASMCVPMVFGGVEILRRVADRCGLQHPSRVLRPDDVSCPEVEVAEPAVVDLDEAADEHVATIAAGRISAATGRASVAYLEAAIRAAMAGEVDAIATGPIHKEALRAAGVAHPGHTELLAARTGATRYCMMLTSDAITCSLVTTHVGYARVPGLLTVEAVRDVIELTADAMQRLRNRTPQLTVCGLNPHAGEGGLFGDRDEERWIVPAVAAARQAGIDVRGPLPPDTAFIPAQRARTDAYICMYHDQGLIPLKALAFDRAVNVTLGLPIVRTSVDHGTALDIAWQGIASHRSLLEAVQLAARLSGQV